MISESCGIKLDVTGTGEFLPPEELEALASPVARQTCRASRRPDCMACCNCSSGAADSQRSTSRRRRPPHGRKRPLSGDPCARVLFRPLN